MLYDLKFVEMKYMKNMTNMKTRRIRKYEEYTDCILMSYDEVCIT